ncbi:MULTISPECIES: hypothetical protein [unclassified Acinetobacter]|uniref:hypothetical protein n=1 Tax=unclassified Acinetobacter TaxID=196816 RepID=UPI00051BADFA|nr:MULTISPECIES: hypothetical protein [unclassified Acinetobacter]MCJ0828679.1 hypothetical protein [Acinetobacter sp. NIPH1876]
MNAAVVTEKLSNLEWVGQQMRAKTANYEASTMSTGEKAPTWEERCGAIASIEDQATKAYCELLVWGDYRDNTLAYHTLEKYFANLLLIQLKKEVKRVRFNLESFALKIAKMTLFLNLRDVDFNTEQKLKFFNIVEVKPRTYREHYAYLEFMVTIALEDMQDEIDFYVDLYRKNIRNS